MTAGNAILGVILDVRGYEIFTAYPLSSFYSDTKGPVLVANLGLLGKMTGSAAILTNETSMTEKGMVTMVTRLKALGVLGKIHGAPFDALRPPSFC